MRHHRCRHRFLPVTPYHCRHTNTADLAKGINVVRVSRLGNGRSIMLDILVAGSDAAGHVNEDAIGHQAGAAWVIDGAAGVGGPLIDAPSDAAWFAGWANYALVHRLSTDPDQPITDLLRR